MLLAACGGGGGGGGGPGGGITTPPPPTTPTPAPTPTPTPTPPLTPANLDVSLTPSLPPSTAGRASDCLDCTPRSGGRSLYGAWSVAELNTAPRILAGVGFGATFLRNAWMVVDNKNNLDGADDTFQLSLKATDAGAIRDGTFRFGGSSGWYRDGLGQMRAIGAAEGVGQPLYLHHLDTALSGSLDYVQLAQYRYQPITGGPTEHVYLVFGDNLSAMAMPLSGVATYEGQTRGTYSDRRNQLVYSMVGDVGVRVNLGSGLVQGKASNFRYMTDTGVVVDAPTIQLTPSGGGAPVTAKLDASIDFTAAIGNAGTLFRPDYRQSISSGSAWLTLSGVTVYGDVNGGFYGPGLTPDELGLAYALKYDEHVWSGGALLGRTSFTPTAPSAFEVVGANVDLATPRTYTPVAGCVYAICSPSARTYGATAVLRSVDSSAVITGGLLPSGLTITVTPDMATPSNPSYLISHSQMGGYAGAFTNIQTTLNDGLVKDIVAPASTFQTGPTGQARAADNLYLFDLTSEIGGVLDYVQGAAFERELAGKGLQIGFMTYGAPTPVAEMPTSSSATYVGRTRGMMDGFASSGHIAMTANFGTGVVAGQANDFRLASLTDGQLGLDPSLGFKFEGVITGASFTGPATAVGGAMFPTGVVAGTFYGAGANAAKEVGLTYDFGGGTNARFMMGVGALRRVP